MSVYKPCDIRGNAATELSPSLYESWGRTLGQPLTPGTTFVVGGDVRRSTPPFLESLVEGLLQSGMNVTNLGSLPTPMIYYAKRQLQAFGCAIVTASHNPATINGLKWMLADRPPTPETVGVLECGVNSPADTGKPRGVLRTVDISSSYLAWLQQTFREFSTVHLHVVLDAMQGCWAGRAKKYLEQVFPQCTFSAIRDVVDIDFGGCTPDCSRPHELRELHAAVPSRQAHLGLAFDGDGDRVALVDNEGVSLSAEEATWVLLHSFGPQIGGSRFVYDQKFSNCIPNTARRLGAEPLVERSGHAFIRTRMCATQSLFGAEISGHYFYQALDGGDDGLYTACRAIGYLAQTGRSLSELRKECPPVFISPDLRVSLSSEAQAEVLARIREQWADYPQQTIDGVRIDMPDGWALLRSSVTESALTFRFEGRDSDSLNRLVRRFCDAMPECGDKLRTQFEAAMRDRKR